MREMLDGLRSVPRKTERIVPLALIGVAAPLLAALAMTLTFAAQETPAPAEDPAAETAVVGLTEILPAEAPAGLEYEDFSILDRKSTRLNSSHVVISYAVFCLKKKTHTRLNSIF